MLLSIGGDGREMSCHRGKLVQYIYCLNERSSDRILKWNSLVYRVQADGV